MNHIIHDIDRDGWGSAALVIADKHPENCRLYPVSEKEICGILQSIEVEEGDVVWILDIPGPASWARFPIRNGVRTIWVDHHLNSWSQLPPPEIEVILPAGIKPTTTMHMLVSNKLVHLQGAINFVHALCSREQKSEWGLVFDGLASLAPNFPVPVKDLPELLARAPSGDSVPDRLKPAASVAQEHAKTVERVLDDSRIDVNEYSTVVYIDDAHGIALRHFSLSTARRHPDKVVVLVHRSTLLYCGTDSRNPRIDLFKYFQARGFKVKGHGYVCFITIAPERIQPELDALNLALKQRKWLTDTISSAAQIREKLQTRLQSDGHRVHFRPSTGGVSMIGLLHESPQLGKSGLSADAIVKDFESLFEKHCNDRHKERDTGEKELQSFLIREAYTNKRKMASINAVSQGTRSPVELIFVTDEIALPTQTSKTVCDILAVRRDSKLGLVPVLLELKNTRSLARLKEQVECYANLLDAHADLFEQLYSVLLGERIRFEGKTEKWIVWPASGLDSEPRESEFAQKGVRVVCYKQDIEKFSFSVGASPGDGTY